MIEGLLARAVEWADGGRAPDLLVRFGIRRLCARRVRMETRGSAAERERTYAGFISDMRRGPIAPVPHRANEQHDDLPLSFFAMILGPSLKYSCCYWIDRTRSLAEAEQASLAVTCQRAGVADGMDVLELGCGWGALTLWMAQHYPNSRITSVSNSAPQRTFIEARASDRGLGNTRVTTADMNAFTTTDRFDRVVSVETFERMCNYEELLGRIAAWLRPSGELFVHVFSHRTAASTTSRPPTPGWRISTAGGTRSCG